MEFKKIVKISELNESAEYKRGFAAGFKFFQMKEMKRHSDDIDQITKDIIELGYIKLPKELDFDTWIEP
jgi:hypothetical protein